MNMLSDEVKARIVEFAKEHPGAEMDQIDDALGGILIMGIGNVQEVTEVDFDKQMVGADKPLLKDKCYYFVNPNF